MFFPGLTKCCDLLCNHIKVKGINSKLHLVTRESTEKLKIQKCLASINYALARISEKYRMKSIYQLSQM